MAREENAMRKASANPYSVQFETATYVACIGSASMSRDAHASQFTAMNGSGGGNGRWKYEVARRTTRDRRHMMFAGVVSAMPRPRFVEPSSGCR